MSKEDKTLQKTSPLTSANLTLHCEIIETFESEGMTIAKIKFEPGLLELTIDPTKEYHLGDVVDVNGKLQVEKIDQRNSEAI